MFSFGLCGDRSLISFEKVDNLKFTESYLKMNRQKIKILHGQPSGCPCMVVELKVNQYIKVTLISAKRFKNVIFRLFAVSSF